MLLRSASLACSRSPRKHPSCYSRWRSSSFLAWLLGFGCVPRRGGIDSPPLGSRSHLRVVAGHSRTPAQALGRQVGGSGPSRRAEPCSAGSLTCPSLTCPSSFRCRRSPFSQYSGLTTPLPAQQRSAVNSSELEAAVAAPPARSRPATTEVRAVGTPATDQAGAERGLAQSQNGGRDLAGGDVRITYTVLIIALLVVIILLVA